MADPTRTAPPQSPELAQARALFTGPDGMSAVVGRTLLAMRGQLVAAVMCSGQADTVAAALVDGVLLPQLQAQAGSLTDALAAVYAAHFTVAELATLQAFQQTPLGRKAQSLAPQLALQSRAATQAWGQRVTAQALTGQGLTGQAPGPDQAAADTLLILPPGTLP